MEKPRISIIVPAYNEANGLPLSVATLHAQTVPFDEIIVVDNNSRDQTASIARKLGCRVVGETKQGLSNARNAGAVAAKGEIVCFMDADGEMSPTWLEEALPLFDDPEISAVSGKNIFRHTDPATEDWYNIYTRLAYASVRAGQRRNRTFLVGNNMAIKRQVFLDLGGFKPVIGEDCWLSHEFWKRPELRGAINENMVIHVSSRRFDEHGFIRTIAKWIVGTALKTPQVKYARVSSQLSSGAA